MDSWLGASTLSPLFWNVSDGIERKRRKNNAAIEFEMKEKEKFIKTYELPNRDLLCVDLEHLVFI